MKKNGIRIFLALVMSLVLILGTVSLVEAKGNPHRSVTVTAIATQDGANYNLSFSLAFEAYRVHKVAWRWYEKVGSNWESREGASGVFTKARRSYSNTYDYWEFHPQDVAFGAEYKVMITLYVFRGAKQVVVAEAEDPVDWGT